VNHAYDRRQKLGKALANDGIRLVYGGGSLGLMGEVARAALGAGGRSPESFGFLVARELMLKDVDDLIVVKNIHMRSS
jgi:predicted Rossmann-fold nucleotide-binding protein